MKSNWYQQAVGYQIYPKSFRDTNGDGIGDIKGIIEKLPYLKDLGIDFIWINPIYKSPQFDGGYDISDYYALDEARFGTMADLKALIAQAHARDMKIIMDLVVNHTSDQHPWFIESRKSKDNPYRDYYHWQPATPEHLPNDWQSFFGGSTWTIDEVTGEAYFHVFAKEQPDLNWHNPKVREAIYEMVRWWLTQGIDGFRLDAISHLEKAPWDFKIKSLDGNDPWEPFMNVTGIEGYMRDLKAIFDAYDALTVGEASGVSSQQAPDWTDDQGYIDMIFELEHTFKDAQGKADILHYKETVMRWQNDLLARGWNAPYLENHDQPRVIDVMGDGTEASAKALAVAYMLLRGTPFIYQGQEIGMTNFDYTDISQVNATDTIYLYQEKLAEGLSKAQALKAATQTSRDHSRTPMQWDNTENAGFSTGTPWLAVNPNYQEKNVARAEKDPDSILALYRFLIQLRHDYSAISEGSIKFLLPSHPTVMAYEREEFLIVTNLSPKATAVTFETPLDHYWDVLTNHSVPTTSLMVLRPWGYHIYRKQ
ncbi:MAG: alpha-glucosidase [Streptococcaceae bacterium]|jgi:alpha-glucosidase|nr:alpha-glucosidase [Streptococcaceae bacterium]